MTLLSAIRHDALTERTIKVLRENSICNVVDLLEADCDRLAIVTRLSCAEILELRNFVVDRFKAPTISALELYDSSALPGRLPTNVTQLDAVLDGGGLPLGRITELCGLPGSGKTQFAFRLVGNAAAISGCDIVYVDTKNAFSATRIHRILESDGLDDEEIANALSRIKVAKVWSMNELVHFFHELRRDEELRQGLRLVVVDSLPALMLQHQGEKNKEGLGLLNNLVSAMRFVADEYQIALVIVNLLTHRQEYEQDEDSTNLVEKKIPTLGKYWKHVPQLYLSSELSRENGRYEIEMSVREAYCNDVSKVKFVLN